MSQQLLKSIKKKIRKFDKIKTMTGEKLMRQEVKKYIDIADVKVVKMIYAMLEADAENDWWNTMPSNIKEQVEVALLQSKNGQVTPHSEVMKKYKKWIVK